MAKKRKSNAGRPTKYKEEYADQAYKLCLLGYVDEQLAQFFEVEVSTINNWKHQHPKFLECLRNGKDIADGQVANSLFQRANGYSHEEDKIFNDQGTPLIVPTVKHYPPDTAAMTLWLKTRQPKIFRDNQNITVSGDPEAPLKVEHSIDAESAALAYSEMIKRSKD